MYKLCSLPTLSELSIVLKCIIIIKKSCSPNHLVFFTYHRRGRPSFPKCPRPRTAFEPIAHNIVLAQKLCLGAIAGTTALCAQYPARVATGESACRMWSFGPAELVHGVARFIPWRTRGIKDREIGLPCVVVCFRGACVGVARFFPWRTRTRGGNQRTGGVVSQNTPWILKKT
jgi:hypothetical protein